MRAIADDGVVEPGTHPCAGRYASLAAFQESTLKRLGAIMKPPGIRLKVRNVIGGGEQEWAVVELVAEAECKNGESSRSDPRGLWVGAVRVSADGDGVGRTEV